MSVIQNKSVQTKKVAAATLAMIFFLVAIPVNSMILTQAILAYTTGNNLLTDGFTGAAIGYGANNVIPILADWGSVIAANGGTAAEIVEGAFVGLAMADPLTLGVFLGLTATA